MLRAPMNGPHYSKQAHLRQMVAAKQQWSQPLSSDSEGKGFRGWHERGLSASLRQAGPGAVCYFSVVGFDASGAAWGVGTSISSFED